MNKDDLLWCAEACERAAKFIREQTPGSLRAWAKRMEDLPESECLPARQMEGVALILRKG